MFPNLTIAPDQARTFPTAPTLAVAIATENWSAAAYSILTAAADTFSEDEATYELTLPQEHPEATTRRPTR